MKSLFKDKVDKRARFMASGNILSIVFMVVNTKLLTNHLDIDEYGVYSLFVSILTFPQLVLYAPLSISIKVLYSRYVGVEAHYFKLSSIKRFIFLSIILALLFFAHLLYFNSFTVSFYICAYFYVLIAGFLQLIDSFLLSKMRYVAFTVLPIFNGLLKTLGVLVVTHYDLVSSGHHIFIVFSVTHLLSLAVYLLYLFSRGESLLNIGSVIKSFKVKTHQDEAILNYVSHMALWSLFSWSQGVVDKLFINSYLGAKEVAIYAVYFQFGYFPFSLLSEIVTQYVTPIFYNLKYNDSKSYISFHNKLINKVLWGILLFLLLLPLLSYYVAPILLKVLTSSEYLEGIKIFPYFVASGIFFLFNQVLTVPVLSSETVNLGKYIKAISMFILIMLYFLLIEKEGVFGVVLSLLICNVLNFIILLYLNYFHKRKIDNK